MPDSLRFGSGAHCYSRLYASLSASRPLLDCSLVSLAHVGDAGLEPAASSSRTTRATICANPRDVIYRNSTAYKLAGLPLLNPVKINNLLPSGQG